MLLRSFNQYRPCRRRTCSLRGAAQASAILVIFGLTAIRLAPLLPAALSQSASPQGPPWIPRLVHFTARSELLRVEYRPLIARWLRVANQPQWTGRPRFYLWRDVDAECLAWRRYSGTRLAEALMTTQGAQTPLERSDLIRVMVLHAMGGLYLDLDTEPKGDLSHLFERPLAGAMLATEPPEHAALLFGLDSLASNAVMFSTAGHPFFKAYGDAIAETLLMGHKTDAPPALTESAESRMLRRRRRRWHRRNNFAAPDVTGPLAMQRVLDDYQITSEIECSNPSCRVHLFPPEIFSPQFDERQKSQFWRLCGRPMRLKSETQRRVCKELRLRNFLQAKLTNASLAVHLFSHGTTSRVFGAFFNATEEFPELVVYANNREKCMQ